MKGVPGDDHPGAAVLLEPSHWSQPRLQPAVIGLDPVVAVLLGAVPRRRQEFLLHGRVHRRLIGDNLDRRDLRGTDRSVEEPTGSLGVPAGGDEHVDDLPELVDRSVHIPPLASDLHIGLVDMPAVADSLAAWLGGVASSGVKRSTHR